MGPGFKRPLIVSQEPDGARKRAVAPGAQICAARQAFDI